MQLEKEGLSLVGVCLQVVSLDVVIVDVASGGCGDLYGTDGSQLGLGCCKLLVAYRVALENKF